MDALTTSLLISLRQLAACLKASSRAYVDPTNVLKIISELNTSLNKAAPCIGIQQVYVKIFDFEWDVILLNFSLLIMSKA